VFKLATLKFGVLFFSPEISNLSDFNGVLDSFKIFSLDEEKYSRWMKHARSDTVP
jgi:hypothetical protein